MPVEKLQINKNFFNKLNSVYSKRKDTNTQSFGSSPVSVITQKSTTPSIKSFTIPDNTEQIIEQPKSVKKIKKKSTSPKKTKDKKVILLNEILTILK